MRIVVGSCGISRCVRLWVLFLVCSVFGCRGSCLFGLCLFGGIYLVLWKVRLICCCFSSGCVFLVSGSMLWKCSCVGLF